MPLLRGELKQAFQRRLYFSLGKFPALATKTDYYTALAFAVRDRLLERWVSTAAEYTRKGSRTVCYFSAEFLMGPHLGNNLINLDIEEETREMLASLGQNLDDLINEEEEPGLGNGG